MRVVLVLAMACIAACSSSSPTGGDGDGGSPIGSSGGSSGGGSSDAGSCVITDGPHAATVFTVTPRGAGTAATWIDPGNVVDTDGKMATATLDSAAESQELRLTGFGFQLPPGAQIKGIEIDLRRQAIGTVYDGGVTLLVEGQTPLVKYYQPTWPTKIVGVHAYGALGELWNTNITAADINKPSFGTSIWVKRDPAGAASTAHIDSVLLYVFYCP